VKHAAFNPLNEDAISAYNIAEMSPEQVDVTGKAVAHDRGPGRSFYGYAEISPEALGPEGLAFEQDDLPRPGHGNIVGWPPGSTPEARSAKLAIAVKLARAATLKKRDLAYTVPESN
jgi:hypothetical protein